MGIYQEIGSRRELLVDTTLVDALSNTTLKLHEPVAAGTAIQLDKPWEGPANGPLAVLPVGDRLHMYYRGMTTDQGDLSGRVCVALSDDSGENWTKPELGLTAYEGNKKTNILAYEDGSSVSRIIPWFDTRPGVSPDERIKSISSEPINGEEHNAFKDPKGPKRAVIHSSADGFTWRRRHEYSQLISDLKNSFDGGCTLFWSEVEQQYVFYYRFMDTHRSVARTVSSDLLTWSDPEPMTYGDSDREHLYTNNTEPYFRSPHTYIAPCARFMQGRRVLTEDQSASINLKTSQGIRYDGDCSEVVLLTTRAGSTHYDRTFMESFVRPGPGYANWVSRTNYPFTGISPYGPDHMQMFVARHYMQDSWHAERFLLRTDGFASVNASYSGGEMITKPFTFQGTELEINFRTGASGSLQVELQEATETSSPSHLLAESDEFIGDEIDRTVRWRSSASIQDFEGKPVRLRFLMKDADLFSLKFNQ
ncbi:MAG: hypothetical protein VX910_04470 [Candidatus Latescibacterota bacterium]|nr:hypothetical protein [Candidatus Latescibacterota bacterium]